MRADRPDIVLLCGTFAGHRDAQARLAAAGYEVAIDPAGSAAASPGPPEVMRFVVCDGDSFELERLQAIIGSAVVSGARVLVVGTSTDSERIITCFRSGASDYLTDAGPGADQIIQRLEAIRAGSGGPGAALANAVQRLVGKLHHDVKNPIGNILGYVDILREDGESPPSEEQSTLLLRIEQNCERALDLLIRFADAANRLR